MVPIIENTARECELTDRLREAIEAYPESNAVLVRRHGVYVWGKDWIQAKTQVCGCGGEGGERGAQRVAGALHCAADHPLARVDTGPRPVWQVAGVAAVTFGRGLGRDRSQCSRAELLRLGCCGVAGTGEGQLQF